MAAFFANTYRNLYTSHHHETQSQKLEKHTEPCRTQEPCDPHETQQKTGKRQTQEAEVQTWSISHTAKSCHTPLKLHNARLATSDVALTSWRNTSITIIHHGHPRKTATTLGPYAASRDSSQRWTEIKRLTKQASDQITPRRTTCTHFTIANSEHTEWQTKPVDSRHRLTKMASRHGPNTISIWANAERTKTSTLTSIHIPQKLPHAKKAVSVRVDREVTFKRGTKLERPAQHTTISFNALLPTASWHLSRKYVPLLPPGWIGVTAPCVG